MAIARLRRGEGDPLAKPVGYVVAIGCVHVTDGVFSMNLQVERDGGTALQIRY
ncbi:MAG: hypothetical protein RIS70_4233 [Planctomycetota bacterium]